MNERHYKQNLQMLRENADGYVNYITKFHEICFINPHIAILTGGLSKYYTNNKGVKI